MKFNVYVQQEGLPEEIAVTSLLKYQWHKYDVFVDVARVAQLSHGTSSIAIEVETPQSTTHVGGYWKLVKYLQDRGLVLC